MRIKMFPPLGITLKVADERGWLEIEEGATLADALKMAGVPRITAKVFMVRVNSEAQPMSTVLHDGDIIGFMTIATGG